jgi:hypothetical protein
VDFLSAVKGGFFLKKKPLECVVPDYTNSEKCYSVASRLLVVPAITPGRIRAVLKWDAIPNPESACFVCRNPLDSAYVPHGRYEGEAGSGSRMRVTSWALQQNLTHAACISGTHGHSSSPQRSRIHHGRSSRVAGTLALFAVMAIAQAQTVPPRVAEAHRFLVERGWGAAHAGISKVRLRSASARPWPQTTATPATASWQPLGPTAVISANYGLVTGRVSSIAFDPADPTGNRVYLGTTGGGVWVSQNAGTSTVASVVFAPLTDTPAALSGAHEASISIGAIAVHPGGTGVILAGTGDPNDALDSYYGAGILRSPDGGTSWKLIQATGDQLYGFIGEGFSGFAWSTTNPQLVVAAVSQAYEGELVDAEEPGVSYEGCITRTTPV